MGRWRRCANVMCIGSGKGGVGKSTLTANLAAALTVEGKRVGILDADVWGYSIPRMYGLGATRPPVSPQRKIVPLEAHGVKVMSIGFFVERGRRRGVARADAAQGAHPVPAGRRLGGARLPADRPSARHRRRLDDARAAAAAGAVRDRHHAAAHRAEGGAPLGRDGPQGLAGDLRRDREHVRASPRPAASATRSSARAAARSSPTNSTCRCSARCR